MSSGSLIARLEQAVKNGSAESRVDMLRRITDLFLTESERLSERQIAVFDDLLLHLTQRIETHALIYLSYCLAPVPNAPVETIRLLSRDDEIAVAGPVLSQSDRLTEDDLVEIARSKSQRHLLAMSGRPTLQQSVTDVLIERGDDEVHHALATNAGARFSQSGYASLVTKSEMNDTLAEELGQRLDIPLELLRQLLIRATDRVRARLLAAAPPDRQEMIHSALAGIASQLVRESSGPRDFTAAESLVTSLNRRGRLNEAKLTEFVKQRKYEEMVATIALFCGCRSELIERLFKKIDTSGVVMIGKAARLRWATVRLILEQRFAPHKPSNAELDLAKDSFLELSQEVAQRSVRFMNAQETAKKIA